MENSKSLPTENLAHQQKSALMTAEAFLVFSNAEKLRKLELVNGVIVEMSPVGYAHTVISSRVHYFLSHYVLSRNLGTVTGEQGGFTIKRNPDTVRAPDVAVVLASQNAANLVEGYFEGAPALAVEVVSPGDTKREVSDKIADYLSCGVHTVWVVEPKKRSVTVHSGMGVQTYYEGDTLNGGDLLPEFSLKVSDIFNIT
jgi:Uma2 family endonuclease